MQTLFYTDSRLQRQYKRRITRDNYVLLFNFLHDMLFLCDGTRSEKDSQTRVSLAKRGQVVEWFSEKGYGFIKPDKSGCDNVFVHVSQVVQKTKITRGSTVTFQSSFDKIKKSDTAFNVDVIGGTPNHTQRECHDRNVKPHYKRENDNDSIHKLRRHEDDAYNHSQSSFHRHPQGTGSAMFACRVGAPHSSPLFRSPE